MANDTISQLKIGNTTYDICDITARNASHTLIYSYDKMLIRDGDHAISVTANQDTKIGYFMEDDPTGADWEEFQTCPTIYHTLVHSTGATRFQRLIAKENSDNSVYHVSCDYINQTYDVVSSMSGVLSKGIAGYSLYINSAVNLTNVYANISWIAFKTL